MSRKRRRSETQERELGEEREREIWESVREEHFEVIDQVPLTLDRQYKLLQELDQQTHGYLDDLLPTIHRYAAYRRNPAILPSTSLPSTPIPLPAERIKPPQSGKEMLSHIAWLAEELINAAQEKVNLAQAAHDYISRQIQVLGQSIKEQEASIALGARPGTQLAPIILPDVAPPSRWTKNVALGLILDDDEPENQTVGTTLGIPPTKKSRKGKRSKDSGQGQTSLKITLPAIYDNKLYCYCHKPSEGEMVACDNDQCQNQWFHLTCTGLSRLPEESETWYCDDCDPDKIPSKKRGRRR